MPGTGLWRSPMAKVQKICLDLLARGRLNAEKMITHTFPLQEINKVFETAQNKQETGALFVALEHRLALNTLSLANTNKKYHYGRSRDYY